MSAAADRLTVSGGRQLLVRPVEPGDAGALGALFDGLDDEDRYRRVFGGYRPPPAFHEQLASMPNGGARFVAEVDDGRTTSIVGEAGYVPLPNGNGELDVTIARCWRGWLGSYLIARVLRVAASQGVPNLEADVLVSNGPMLAVLRSFGSVIVGRDGWNVVRLMIGTDGVPSWPSDHHRPRVLVEAARGRWKLEDAARAAGIDVITCRGPGHGHACPALAGEPCPLVAGADAVIVRDCRADEPWGPVVEANRKLHPQVPILVDRPGEQRSPQRIEELLDVVRPE